MSTATKNRTHLTRLFILAIYCLSLVVFITGCPPKKKTEDKFPMYRIDLSEYPVFTDDLSFRDLQPAIKKSLSYLNKLPLDRQFSFGKDIYTAGHLIKSLVRFRGFLESGKGIDALNDFIRKHYLVYRSRGEGENGRVLFTGYFEPLLSGSLVRTAKFRFPVYAKPDDLAVVDLSRFSDKFKGQYIIGRVDGKTFVPYYERKQIDQEKVLSGKAEVIAWVDDPVALFFLHIQGSGKIRLKNGQILSVSYHAKNGRPYRSIGQYLIDHEKIPLSEMSMQKIREYLSLHPEDQEAVLHFNPSYIFFRRVEDGPVGAMNEVITPGRSIALDKDIFPRSALTFVETRKPILTRDGKIEKWIDFSRFTLNQDTGGAIKGPGRVDFFWGNGHYAEMAAGHMRHEGRLFFLVLRPG